MFVVLYVMELLTTQNMTLCIKSGQPVLDWCAATYLEHIIPGKKITVDKSMFKFKGRYYFKQYLPMKPVKLDIHVKLLALRDSETGAVLKYILESLTMEILAGPQKSCYDFIRATPR